MSASAEIPDFVSGITNTLGLNKLWQTDQQSESEKWREARDEELESAKEEAKRTKQTDNNNSGHGDVTPVSIAQEKEKEKSDHDEEVHGVPKTRSTDSEKKKGYEWPMPATIKKAQTNGNAEPSSTLNEKETDSGEASGRIEADGVDEEKTEKPTADNERRASKAQFLGALKPFFSQQKVWRNDSPSSTPQTAPPNQEDPFQRPRPSSSSSGQKVERPTPQRRQYTMPIHGRIPGQSDSSKKTAARSRWQNAAQNLRFPLRRRKTDRQTEQTGGGSQVIATLAAGAPAATLIASHMLADERSHHRVPVIVDLLSIQISDSKTGPRGHAQYRIDLTYGEGPTQMKWTIYREQRDFQALHNRLRLLYLRRREKLPEFPHSTFTFWLGNFGVGKEERKEAKEKIPQQLGPGVAAGIGALAAAVGGGVPEIKKKDVQLMVRIKLQEYITQLTLFLRARPGLNRLCKFLELSTLGIRLASENSYHGKEGWLVIASLKGSNAGINCNPRLYKRRYTPKWFMVRHSYIVCVEDIAGMKIYDVFLVDSDFKVEWNALPGISKRIENEEHAKHHLFTISNAERKFKLGSNSDKKMMQFIQSIQMMRDITPWAMQHRFESFAPVRQNVQAQCLVDGRDYFWNVSRAILKARDVIYIHGWWLSPELHMRRPAANAQKWRLDRLLQRKAQEGVKIYVIIYQNVGTTVPIDSTHSKYSLLGLHPNVFVQRSPRHVGGLGGQNVFFWAHHEKIISIDHTVGFVGGLDLCFGRWDSPEHVLNDDKPSGFEEGMEGKSIKDPQVWPGKDYSNPRIHDFYELDKPYEDMYDRKQVPRMPWHDVSMQLTGQPARDIARHFVQRWNYLLRTKPPSKPTPILLPPPDFKPRELEALNLTGTCEVQLLRSCGQWSMGFQEKTEQSIQNAYLKCIEQSEHFVYIENQFFITSCDCDGTKIENQIGNAIVNRVIRAHKEGTEWRAVIIIPLMPGFQNTIDSPDGSSLRLIMYAQYYSLCRGETSIFGRLRRANIDPEDYISVYGLRGWGKIGDQDQLVTEQVYIHAKIMIVDDRVAIIGSANINERSMRGNRDSEVAAIVRDTEQYEITMAGKPFMVGKFAHTLRMRLQLEHLGVNTDDFEQRTWMMDGLARQKTQKVKSWEEKVQRPSVPAQPFSFNHDEPWRGKYGHWERRASSDDEKEHMQDENEKHKAWYHQKFGKSRSRSASLEKHRSRSLTSYSMDHPQSQSRSSSPYQARAQTYPEQQHISRRPDGLSANHTEFQSNDDAATLPNGSHDKKSTKPEHQDTTNHSESYEKLNANSHPNYSIPKSIDRSKIGRPTVTTSANPLTGGIPPNMAGSPTLLDRAEELEQSKRDPDLKRKSMGESSGETLSDSKSHLPLLASPAILGSPKPLVHHGDGGSFLSPPPKISQVTERPIPIVDPYNFIDPLAETFFFDQWHAVAEHNTAVYRRVFRPMPDNDVKTWSEYKEFFAFGERLAKAQGGEKGKMRVQVEQQGASGPVGAPVSGKLFAASKLDHANRDNIKEYVEGGEKISQDEEKRIKEDLKQTKGDLAHEEHEVRDDIKHVDHEIKEDMSEAKHSLEHVPSEPGSPLSPTSSRRRRAKSNATRAGQLAILPRDTMEELLGEVQGHLVIWPTDWLEKEDANGNFLYNIDKVQPMEIYD